MRNNLHLAQELAFLISGCENHPVDHVNATAGFVVKGVRQERSTTGELKACAVFTFTHHLPQSARLEAVPAEEVDVFGFEGHPPVDLDEAAERAADVLLCE